MEFLFLLIYDVLKINGRKEKVNIHQLHNDNPVISKSRLQPLKTINSPAVRELQTKRKPSKTHSMQKSEKSNSIITIFALPLKFLRKL